MQHEIILREIKLSFPGTNLTKYIITKGYFKPTYNRIPCQKLTEILIFHLKGKNISQIFPEHTNLLSPRDNPLLMTTDYNVDPSQSL